MADIDTSLETSNLNRARFIAAALETVGVLFVVGGLAWAIERFWSINQAAQPAIGDFLSAAVLLLGSLAVGVLLWAVAELVRKLDALVSAGWSAGFSQEWGERPAAATGSAPRGEEGASEPSMHEVAALLRELRDISMLSEPQRAARLELQGREAYRRLEQEVPVLLRDHNWVEARRRIQQSRERFPQITRWDALEQQVEQMRSSVESRDIESTTRQINDLIALGAWDRVQDAVRDLLERHPESPRATDLARRVTLQHEKVDAEQRARLMAQAQDATSRRDWNAALTSATTLLHRFPRSAEADALRTQVATLRENAEIQTRQRMESEYREHIRNHAFDEALRVARELLDQYPNSPQAQVLREQYPRLLEKAAGGDQVFNP